MDSVAGCSAGVENLGCSLRVVPVLSNPAKLNLLMEGWDLFP